LLVSLFECLTSSSAYKKWTSWFYDQ